jgi:hypothetical protein
MPFTTNRIGPVVQRGEIDDARCDADAIEFLRRRILVAGTPLGDRQDALVACHGAVDGALGRLAAHEQRHDHLWEEHEISQRHGRQAGRGGRKGSRLSSERLVFGLNPGTQDIPVMKAQDPGDQLQALTMSEGDGFGLQRLS